MLRIKTVKIKNSKNVLVQMPKFILSNWEVKEGDGLEVLLDEETREIVIRPTEGYTKVYSRSNAN